MSIQGNTITATINKPKYAGSFNQDFITSLKDRVEGYFLRTGLSRKGGWEITVKTTVLLGLFIVSYFLMLSNWFTGFGLLSIALLFGGINVLIVFNISHDAAHNALFKNRKLNRALTYTFNLVGANAYLWDITHNQIHHTYPNIGEYDTDIEQQAPLIRVSPTVSLRWYHRYQHIYAPLLYLTYSFFLVFIKDFQDIGILPKKDSKLLENRKHATEEYLIFFGSKLFYYCLTIVIPLLVLDISWQLFLVGFIAVHIFMSLLLSMVLIPVHMVDEATFDTVDDQSTIRENWYVHVFKNTVDYARDKIWANILFGGLNTHLVHHLFPGICHVHYIGLSDVLKDTAREYGLEYRDITMTQAIASHFRLLKRMGRKSYELT